MKMITKVELNPDGSVFVFSEDGSWQFVPTEKVFKVEEQTEENNN